MATANEIANDLRLHAVEVLNAATAQIKYAHKIVLIADFMEKG